MLKMMGVCVGRIAAGRPVRRLPLMPVQGLLGPEHSCYHGNGETQVDAGNVWEA